jgi:hypothetical protein
MVFIEGSPTRSMELHAHATNDGPLCPSKKNDGPLCSTKKKMMALCFFQKKEKKGWLFHRRGILS